MTSLRIAFFTNAFPVPSEPFIELQAAELVRNGHEVTIFGLSGHGPSASSSSDEVRALLNGRYSNVVVPESLAARIGASARASFRTLRKAGVASLPILQPLTFRRTWVDLSAVFQGELVAGHGPFDILHCQFATLGEHVLKLKRAGLLEGRMIIHFRGYDITEVVQAAGASVYDHLWDNAAGFIANCDYFRGKAIEIGCPSDRIQVIGSGIDLAGFPYRPPLRISDDHVRILAVGRLTARKGFHTLIEAAGALLRSGQSLELTIIGEGAERGRLEELIARSGLEGCVILKGRMPHQAIRQRLEESHIFVAPSETCPLGGADAPVNTIKEAMAVGVPVCATRHGGIPELVEEGVTGTLAREGDGVDLAKAIGRLIDMAPRWDEMTQTARTRVKSQYEITRVTETLIAAYRAALPENDSTEGCK